MSIRVTIMMDEDISKSIRILQSEEMTKKNVFVSFSHITNDLLKKSLTQK